MATRIGSSYAPGPSRPPFSDLSRRGFLLSAGAALSPGVLRASPANKLDGLLDEISRRACRYFFEQANPANGLVRDRASAEGPEDRRIASIAATGFGLSALTIAYRRRYLDRSAVRARVLNTLDYLAHQAPHERGFFPHFLDLHTGKRAWASEFSSVDTAWLLCGVLHARSEFESHAVREAADKILGRVNWRWMLNGDDTLSHGWTPEAGFLPYRWDCYAELLAMYLLAIGSETHPIPTACWNAWQRPMARCAGATYLDAPAPLFAHQYSHAWFDFRGRRDRYTDYFENSRLATHAHRDWCRSFAGRFPWYGEMWGVTASDSRHGYVAWGHPSSETGPDGTVVPCAVGGSIPFLPEECGSVLQTILARHGKTVWGRYGFADAFHPDGWVCPDVIGINVGIMLLMAENHRSGSVWRAVMATPEAGRGMKAVRLELA